MVSLLGQKVLSRGFWRARWRVNFTPEPRVVAGHLSAGDQATGDMGRSSTRSLKRAKGLVVGGRRVIHHGAAHLGGVNIAMSWAFPYDHPGTAEMFIDVIMGNWNDELDLVVPQAFTPCDWRACRTRGETRQTHQDDRMAGSTQ